MATVLRAWTVEADKLVEIPELRAADQGLVEQRLEDWLESQPDAIEDNLLIIGRQVHTASGPLDLLGITADGKLVVVELKRDRAPRETVAQAIDYASWVASQAPDDIAAIASNYLGRPLGDAFQDRFAGEALPELQLQSPSILVVASRLDASTERMIEFLSKQYSLDIDGLVFRFVRLSNGSEVLVRTSVVSEEQRISRSEPYRVPEETLLALARERRIVPMLAILRRIGEFLWEGPARTYGGSFRYWRDRMLCGVNVASYWGAPEGSIDVWVSHGWWAQITGLPEDSFVGPLRDGFEFVKQYEGSHQMILRISSEDQALKFVALLRSWAEGGQVSE
jgi:hypothetical protein